MLRLRIYYEPSERVVDLEGKIKRLENQLLEEQKKYKTLQLDFVNECKMNLELVDLLQAYGIKFRRPLSRTWRR